LYDFGADDCDDSGRCLCFQKAEDALIAFVAV
jgi:hypothetical protein